MGAFADIRNALAADLTPLGIPVHPSWPVSLTVPCVFLTPPLAGSEYLRAGPTFGAYTMAVDMVILVAHGPAEVAFAELENLIEAALANSMDWDLLGVDSPSPVAVTDSGADYLGTVIHLSKSTRLT